MIPLNRETFSPIAKAIAPEGQFRQLWPLTGGMSAEMVALEIELPDGRRNKYVVRWYDPTKFGDTAPPLANEQKLLKLIRSANIKAPDSCLLDNSLSRFPAEYLVISFIEGVMSFAPPDRSYHVRQLAHQLAQIHQLKAADHDLTFLPKAARCPELAREPARLDTSLREPEIRRRLGSLPHPVSQNEAALLHGDFWPGNSLWLNGKLQAVIDWEDAQVGDPLCDFAKSRLETKLIFGLKAFELFTATYQILMPLDYTNLPYWDLCAALRLIRLVANDLPGMATYFHPYGRPDITAATLSQMCDHFVTEALRKLAD